MDERLDYSSEEQLPNSSSFTSDWNNRRNIASAQTLDADPSTLFLKYKNYHLNLIQKKEYTSERPAIPALKHQRLSYYRNYACSPNKTEIVCKTTNSFNRMFWSYIFNVFLKTLPHMYVQVFLAWYAPEEHLFVPKMIPFLYGFKFAFIMTSIFEFLTNIDHSILTLGYLVHGVLRKNPWNRKLRSLFNKIPKEVAELTDEKLILRVKDDKDTWKLPVMPNYQLAPLRNVVNKKLYFLENILTQKLRIVYFITLWSLTVFSYRAVVTKVFWKSINAVQVFVLVMECIPLIYLLNSYFDETHIPETPTEFSEKLSQADIDLLAESTTSPPVVHVLTSRSTEKIEPRRDSSFICLSNAATYIFRFILMTRLRNHCNFLAGTQIHTTLFSQYSWFYYWPLFFSTFYFGDLFTLGFMFIRLLIDTLSLCGLTYLFSTDFKRIECSQFDSTYVVTYHCYVEVIVCEWKWINEWIVTLFTTLTTLFLVVHLSDCTHALMNIHSKGIATFCEILALYYLYSAGRLVDDVMFHTGKSISILKLFCFRFMPIFYFVKLYIIMDTINKVLTVRNFKNYGHLNWSWTLSLIPYMIGMVYISYKYIILDKVGWQRMFVPTADWGPREYNIRRLRKEYDSRYFIKSQATRDLSRYMIDKSEAQAFQLDLNYDPLNISTITASKFRLDTEKKDL